MNALRVYAVVVLLAYASEFANAEEVTVRRNVAVTMRDGVHLAADLYMPTTPAKAPVVLTLTPYGRNFWNNGALDAKGRWFAQHGYVFAAVDVRGRFDSEGAWDPFDSKHKNDGYDTVEWLANQSWSNGKVGMWGTSYMGWTQWWTASTVPPHLAAIVPLNAPADHFEDNPYRSGALTGGWLPDWAARMSSRTDINIAYVLGPRSVRARHEAFMHTPYADINSHRGIASGGGWLSEWYRQNKSTDPYWAAIAYQDERHYSKMTVPALSITGWFDVSHPGSTMNYIGMKRFGATPQARRPSLIIGPWTHYMFERQVAGIDYGEEAAIDVDGLALRWFDHFLKGIDNSVEQEPPVRVFVMGENKWRAAQDWPLPETKLTKYYFVSKGRANSFKGDGVLTTTPPRVTGSDTYQYDPRHPTIDPYVDEAARGGAADTRLSASGDDVLVYQTPPLESAVEVTGPLEATLYSATSARDTDWMVRLVDVYPDGRALVLADGVLRARSRDALNSGRFDSTQFSTIEPGKVYRYTIRFWRGTANLFQRGHRIRVEVSSSWFPFFLPNLNTGADNLATVLASEAVVARETVHWGSKYPSHILLPVIPARGR